MFNIEECLSLLERTGYNFYLQTYSALDKYYQYKPHIYFFFLTDAPLQLFSNLFLEAEIEYFKTEESDVLVQVDEWQFYFQCFDNFYEIPKRNLSVLNIYYDYFTDSFLDPFSVYKDLRSKNLRSINKGYSTTDIKDAALLASRYNFDTANFNFSNFDDNFIPLTLREQRLLLYLILTSEKPGLGLNLLAKTNFINYYWPELSKMSQIPQTKDYHPEGDVWEHILEAFNYRKKTDPLLSFAILLHDLGKTIAPRTRFKAYADHSLLGAKLAEQFLKRLQFPQSFIDDIFFLVRYHMMPEALGKMPLYRIEHLLSNRLFPILLELYRSDLLATFQSPEKYYQACTIYRNYLKSCKNPFRNLKANQRIVG